MERIHSLFLFSGFLLLASCAGIPNVSVDRLQGELPPDRGIVVAETLNNNTRITGPVRRWDEIILWRVIDEDEKENEKKENRTFFITALNNSISTQSYMGAVPAGTYRIGLLYATLTVGDVTYTGRAYVFPEIGTFDVTPGQVTNLGTILYQPFQDRTRTQSEYPDYSLTRISNDSLWENIKEARPVVKDMIDPNLPVKGWNPDEYGQQREKAVELIRNAALPTDLHILSNGDYLLTGFFGVIYYKSGGKWRQYHTGQHYKILDFAEMPNGQWLIAGEFGHLELIDEPGEESEIIKVDSGLAHIVDIEISDNGQIYIVSNGEHEFRLFKFSLQKKTTTLLKKLEKQAVGFWGTGVSRPFTISTENGVAVYMDNKVHRYNELNDTWVVEKAPEYVDMIQQQDGYLLATPYSAFTGGIRSMTFSADRGLTWSESDERVGLFSPASGKLTYRFSNGDLLRTGKDTEYIFFQGVKTKEEVPIIMSQDNGANWETVGAVPPGCLTIAAEASTDNLVYILCSDGSVLKSEDRGKSWRQSLSPRLPDFEDFPKELKFKYER